jgi:hypothetical protein
MVSLAEDWTIIEQSTLNHYHEGPWMFTRRNDAGTKIYYLMYPGNPGGPGGAEMLYAMSTNPGTDWQNWEYKGSILGKVNTGDTSHGSVVQFKGQWYIFYHDATLSEGEGTLRSVCVDELFFNADGTIKPVTQTKGAGGLGIGVHPRGPAVSTSPLGIIENKYFPPGEANYDSYNVLDKQYNAVKSNNVLSDNVTVSGGAGISDQVAVGSMHIFGSYVEFSGINGRTGGKALLRLEHAKGDNGSAGLKMDIGSRSYRIICTPTGGWPTFVNTAYCLIDLQAGTNNTIRFSGAGVNIKSFSIYFEP